jgi:hypothetical protein
MDVNTRSVGFRKRVKVVRCTRVFTRRKINRYKDILDIKVIKWKKVYVARGFIPALCDTDTSLQPGKCIINVCQLKCNFTPFFK